MIVIVTPDIRKRVPWIDGTEDGEEFEICDKPFLFELLYSNIEELKLLKIDDLIQAIKTASYLFSPHFETLVHELTWKVGGNIRQWRRFFSQKVDELWEVHPKLRESDRELYESLRSVWKIPTVGLTMGLRKEYIINCFNIGMYGTLRFVNWWITSKKMKIDEYIRNNTTNVEILKLIPLDTIKNINIKSSTLECITYLHEHGGIFTYNSLFKPCKNNNLDAVKYIKNILLKNREDAKLQLLDDTMSNHQKSKLNDDIRQSWQIPNYRWLFYTNVDIWRELFYEYSIYPIEERSVFISIAINRSSEYINLLISLGEDLINFKKKLIVGSTDTIDHLINLGLNITSDIEIWKPISNKIIDHLTLRGMIWTQQHLEDTKKYIYGEKQRIMYARITYHMNIQDSKISL